MSDDVATAATAAFLEGVSWEALPDPVRDRSAAVLLDSVACGTAGATVPAGRSLLSSWGFEADGWIRAPDRSVAAVAGANAQAANVLDFDTTYRNIGHPGSVAACTAVTVGARTGASGRDVLTALAAGYEVAARIGDALQPSPQQRERVWPWGSWHVFAATGAAAVLRDLSEAECRQAINVACGTAPVSMVNRILEPPSTILKNAHRWATRAGVEAVELAADGVTGYPRGLDGATGFHAAAGSDRWRPDELVEALQDGTRWAITDASVKPYPICRWTHTCVDAAYQLADSGVDPAAVESITVRTVPQLAEPIHDAVPETHAEATWSVQWGIGCALTGIEPGAAWYAAERFEDDAFQTLLECVEVQPDDAYGDAFPETIPATVRVETEAGTTAETVRHPTGSPERPVTREARVRKARRLFAAAGVTDPEDRVDAIRDVASRRTVATLLESP